MAKSRYIDATPKWVHRGSGVFDTANGKALFGVGIVEGVRNKVLARQTCDKRARHEVAKMFDLYLGAMMKNYQRLAAAHSWASAEDVVSAQKTITKVTLRSVVIRNHWQNPASGTLYVLAVLDINGIMKSLNRAKQLNATVRDYVRANARKAFIDLDKKLNKCSDRNK